MKSIQNCIALHAGLVRSLATACPSEFFVKAAFGSAGRASMSTGVVRGLNILKNGQDPEEIKEDDVPEWLRELGRHGAGRTLPELERKAELTSQEARQLAKLRNRQKIKRKNSLSSK